MGVATLLFGSYRPDQPALTPDIVSVAENVLPGPNGWRPVPSFVALPGTNLPSKPLGGFSGRSSSSVTRIFAGTATALYTYNATNWTAAGSNYSASALGWSFIQYGDRVIAANGADPLQWFDLSMPNTFAPLGGSPPVLSFLAVVKGFIVGGRPNGNAQAIHWSGNNNSTIWDQGVGESDDQYFPDGGPVNAIAGGEFGLVLQESTIRRMDYVGGNTIFDISVISPNVGCVAPKSFAQVGSRCFFLSQRGFMTCDGAGVAPIGDERVDATFKAIADPSFYNSMSAVADPVNKIVIWTVPAVAPDTWFVYSWALDEWTVIKQSVPFAFSASSSTATLEDLDTLAPPNMDAAGVSVDDPRFSGGVPFLYLFNASFRLGTLSGTPMAYKLRTPFIAPDAERSIRIRRTRPLTDAEAGITMIVDSRPRLGAAIISKQTTSFMPDGTMPIIARGRYMAAELRGAAGNAFTFSKGIRFEYESEGRGL